MSKERYDPQSDSWEQKGPPDRTPTAEAIYEQVGQRFYIEWVDGQPVVDWDHPTLEGLNEQDVKQAIRDNV